MDLYRSSHIITLARVDKEGFHHTLRNYTVRDIRCSAVINFDVIPRMNRVMIKSEFFRDGKRARPGTVLWTLTMLLEDNNVLLRNGKFSRCMVCSIPKKTKKIALYLGDAPYVEKFSF